MVSKKIDQSSEKGRQKRVALGMSGGVDSAVSAALLVEQGYEVTGVFLECWRAPGCRVDEDRKDAMDVAMKLKIPFKVLDFKEEYKAKVVDYFYREYAAGRTPNPDVMCNREIKFGMFYEWAMGAKFDYVATGHYARIETIREISNDKFQMTNEIQNPKFESASLDSSPAVQNDKGWRLLRGVDEMKDQSYFLYQLREEQLSHILFPIGEMTKDQVREEAKKRRLGVAEKPDSQGICFIGPVSTKAFLMDLGMREKRGGVFLKIKNQKSKFKMTPLRQGFAGQAKQNATSKSAALARSFADAQDDKEVENTSPLVQNDGLVQAGEHDGVWFYTVGQRVALQIPDTRYQMPERKRRAYKKNLRLAGLDPSHLPPVYVVEKDVERNRLVVGRRDAVMRNRIEIGEIHLIDARCKMQDVRDLAVRIRHGGRLVKAKCQMTNDKLKLKLAEHVFGVAAGQAMVFYQGERVLGGGMIQ